MKKMVMIGVMLAAVCAFGALPEGGPYRETVGGIEWTFMVDANMEASVGTGYSVAIPQSTRGGITIPSSLGGRAVTTVGEHAFYECSSLTHVTMPMGVTSIGNSALMLCSSLTSVTIPSSVTNVGSHAFCNCSNLRSVTIPVGVTNIGERAFYGCSALASVTIPPSVMNIGYLSFYKCPKLGTGVVIVDNCVLTVNGSCPSSVVLPEGTRLIAGGAFNECSEMTSVTIPSSVEGIGDSAFRGCTGLGDGLVIIDHCVLLVNGSCPSSVALPSGTRLIAGGVFWNCDDVMSITIPSSVMSIGENAFYVCRNLQTIDFEGAPPNGVTNARIATEAVIRYNVAYQDQWLPVIQQCGWTNAMPYVPVGPIDDCITFSSEAAFTLSVAQKGWDGTLWTSTDKVNWTEWNGEEVEAAGAGGTYTLFVRGSADNTKISGRISEKWNLSGSAGIACSGNIETLRGATGNAPSLTPMAEGCYFVLFADCTSLTAAPELPSTTLAKYCYYGMFENCTALKMAPALPAMIVAENCYHSMFWGCTSLKVPPKLPAVVLESSCYYSMFWGCTSLMTAPALPAMIMAENCYGWMFNGCSSLRVAPALPATTLAKNCYEHMFEGCTALMTAPALSATNLEFECYAGMFRGCKSLVSAPDLPAATLADFCYCEMFRNCTSLRVAPALPAMALTLWCYGYMFDGCTSLTSVPELPATTLSDRCCYWMFHNCTAVEVNMKGPGIAWTIPATKGATSWGKEMFTGTAGTLQGQPELNRTYYIASAPIPPGPKPEGGPYTEKVGSTTWTFMVDDSLEAVVGTGDPMGEPAIPTSTKGAITIPSELGERDVAVIADCAFAGCSKVTAVTIPAGVEEIGVDVFDGCSSLTAINVAAGNESYSSVDGILFDGDMTTLIQCPGGKQGAYEVPDDVERIADYAFADCAKITDVTLASDVTGIGAYAFMDCGVARITIPSSVEYVGENAFLACPNLKKVYVEDEEEVDRVRGMMEDSGFDTDQVEFRIIGETPTFEVVAGMKVSIDVGFVGYTAKNLPKGLSFNGRTGLVTGTTKVTGTYEATFSKKGEWDETAIFEVRDEADPEIDCPGLEAGAFTVGVAGESGGILIGITAESGVKSVSAKNLPAGMKVTQDKLTKEWYITGGPTKAGYYPVTLTVTTAAGNRADQSYVIEVAALPDMAVGTFNGFVTKRDDAERFDPVIGAIQVTATDAGKISAKVTTADKAYSFAATCWDSGKEGRFSVEMSLKTGETLTLELDTGAGWDAHQLTGSFYHKVLSGPFEVSAQRNAFGKTWSFDAEGDATEGWMLTYAENPKTADLTLTLNADGKTTLAGKLGTLKVSASGYSDVSVIADGAIIADFAPVVTVNKVKTILSIHTNLWFDRSNVHEFIGSAKLMD